MCANEQTKATIEEVIREVTGVSDPALALGYIDSLDALEILVTIEQRFGIRIEDDDLNSELLDNLEQITAYVERRLASSATRGPV
jgi:acyl carrier protein